MHNRAEFIIKGMQKDTSESKFNPQFAFDNRNVRITPTDDNTLLSLVNEKGTKDLNVPIDGVPIGEATIGDDVVLFTTGGIKDINIKPIVLPSNIIHKYYSVRDITIDRNDNIYKLWFDDIDKDVLNCERLFSGDLNFSANYPMETLAFYENENIKKVYWVDGLNPPRVINIEASNHIRNSWYNSDNRSPFNFVRSLKLREDVTIVKNDISNGLFAPGTIQYAFTYFDKFGSESNIFYTSPLYYISYGNRGANPEDTLGNSFNIHIGNIDDSFEYVRIYSIQRTSVNGTPLVKNVADIKPSNILSSVSIVNSTFTNNTDNVDLGNNTNLSIYENSHKKDLAQYKVVEKSGNYETYLLPEGNDYIIVNENNNNAINCIQNTSKNQLKLTKQTIGNTESYSVEGNSKYGNTYVENTSYEINFTDTGTTGTIVDPSKLLFVGGEEIIAGTISQKDNTLFLGDISMRRKDIAKDIKEYFNKNSVRNRLMFKQNEKSFPIPSAEGLYPYKSQLSKNSQEIKVFKYLETYRLGIQFQHYTGKWSEPIWLGDRKNNFPIISDSSRNVFKSSIPTLNLSSSNAEDLNIIKSLLADGYVKVRPVVVYPTINDRSCLCQGVVCPTVFNAKSRFENAPYVQSSWFARPYDYRSYTSPTHAEVVVEGALSLPVENTTPARIYIVDKSGNTTSLANIDPKMGKGLIPVEPETRIINYNTYNRINLPGGEYINISETNTNFKAVYTVSPEKGDTVTLSTESGEIQFNTYRNVTPDDDYNFPVIEFRNNYPIKESSSAGAEIQNIDNKGKEIKASIKGSSGSPSEEELRNWAFDNGNNFFVDQSIFTMHSPDIEFDSNMNAISSSNVKFRIVGYVPITSVSSDIDIILDKHLPAYDSTKDWFGAESSFYKETTNVPNDSPRALRTLSSGNFLINKLYALGAKDTFGSTVYAFNRKNAYTFKSDSSKNKDRYNIDIISKCMSNLRFSYNTKYFNTNKIWESYIINSNDRTGISGVSIFNANYPGLTRIKKPLNSSLDSDITYLGDVNTQLTYPNNSGYNCYKTKVYDKNVTNHTIFESNSKEIDETSLDIIDMHYKSTPHAIISLNYSMDNKIRVLPTMNSINPVNDTLANNYRYFWDKSNTKINGVKQDSISAGSSNGWLWLGELYIDDSDIKNRFGGTSPEAIQANNWLPCGDAINLKLDNETINSNINIKWSEGDTYYQRYDNLKTYAPTIKEVNGVVDIVSFMCETRVNIDGRFDTNRGLVDNLTVSPKNFNLMNLAYSQSNNFFNYKDLDDTRFNLDNFRNTVTWTKTKVSGELTDTWTNITLASTLDLDGDKGPVRAIKRFNNNLIAFQDEGISQILYNENTQIATTDGVPIELANSGKVQGKRYLSDNVGCRNKWSICESPAGIYFIDDISKNLFNYNGQLNNLSDKLGFHSWIVDNTKDADIWNPINFNNLVTYYDKINKEILFITKKECLVYSEILGQFTSFYSYGKTPYFVNISDRALLINKAYNSEIYRMWLYNGGDYNYFFNKYEPFSTTIIANPEMPKDKVFDTIEFRADSFDNGEMINDTFDTLDAYNEYQKGTSALEFNPNKPSTLKRKFRIWRANIPRDNAHRMNRIRNPWVYIKLAKNKPNKYKTILHDIIVNYFD